MLENKISLALLSLGFLVCSLVAVRRQNYPNIILYNPATQLAERVEANRSETQIQELFRGGLRNATAIALGAYPYEPPSPDQLRVQKRIMAQFFSPDCAAYIQEIRNATAQANPYGTVRLTYNSYESHGLTTIPQDGAFYFETLFNVTRSIQGNKREVRTGQSNGPTCAHHT